MAIRPPFQSSRITAQKGMFTIHGRAAKGLEQYRFGDHLVKVVIPRHSATRMMDQLATLGITETVVFPELEALTASGRPARIRKARGKS